MQRLTQKPKQNAYEYTLQLRDKATDIHRTILLVFTRMTIELVQNKHVDTSHQCTGINRVETIQSDRPVQTTRSRSYLRSFNSMVLEAKIDLRATQSQQNTSQRLLQSRPTTELRSRGGIQTPSRNPSHSETSYQSNTVNKQTPRPKKRRNGDIRTSHTTHIHPHGDESSQNPETEKSKTEQ